MDIDTVATPIIPNARPPTAGPSSQTLEEGHMTEGRDDVGEESHRDQEARRPMRPFVGATSSCPAFIYLLAVVEGALVEPVRAVVRLVLADIDILVLEGGRVSADAGLVDV
jgi:hypothetical protein